MCSSWTIRNWSIGSTECWIMQTSKSLQRYGNPQSTLNKAAEVWEWKCAWSNYYRAQCCCASVLTNTEWREKACMAALMWIWQQQWICDGGDYHKLFFCRNILGIDECKEEKRLLQSLAVRRFLTSLCVSIFLLAERYEKRKRRVREGRGGILRWRRHSLAWALDIKRWAKDVTNEADADTMIESLLSLYHFGSGSANRNQKSFIRHANR